MEKPNASGSTDRAMLLPIPISLRPTRTGGIRIDVRSPNRDCQSWRPSSNAMKAFGVVR
jgi:hypothetical protein